MSKQLINEYRAELDRLRAVSGSRREGVLSEAFKDLLKRWGRAHDLTFTAQHEIITPQGARIYPDGAMLHGLRVPFGYWEAKDADDKLDAEIAAKFRRGYPRDNIIFSDDRVAVLVQGGHETARVAMDDVDALDRLLTRFFAHERAEIADFNRAVKQFALDLPHVLEELRRLIAEKHAASRDFAAALRAFLDHARDAINPAVTEDDVREMLIQHVLTEDIFAKVFDNPDFHRQNNVAAELYRLEGALFGYGEKQRLLRGLQPYYAGISRTAAVISSHSEKQGFLKALYENFYKVYNPKSADRLGVVYTPGEIVRFMIRSADWLCEKHWGRNLIDPGVEILDPATGTGTFVVELLEHFRGDHAKLRHKYKEEIHANEIGILPYYVANLNIEATYQAITGQFAEYPNLCLVDTLDNVAALGIYSGHQHDLLASLSDENMERVKRQNRRRISVIIGNPPYNAWQESYNQDNANRPYTRVDQRIKATYVKEGTAQNKNSVYDMYTRFVRWASDRLSDDGVIAFVIGRKPISKNAYDGFRKVVEREFSEVWLMDLGGDVRDNPKLSGTAHNVFGIQTGVMIVLLVKRKGVKGCTIRYARRDEMERAEDKLAWLGHAKTVENVLFDTVKPNAKHDWLDQASGDWSSFLPLMDPDTKTDARSTSTKALFKLFSRGVGTYRDEWVYDRDRKALASKVRLLIDVYEKARRNANHGTRDTIKWDAELARYRESDIPITFDHTKIVSAAFRPFIREWLYFDRHLNGRRYQLPSFYQADPNPTIAFLGIASSNEFAALGIDRVFDLGLVKAGNGGTQGIARYRYTKTGERIDNITDWALARFREAYGKPLPFRGGVGVGPVDAPELAGEGMPTAPTPSPSPGPKAGDAQREGSEKNAIFHYVYAVLHDPLYRETYALNLRREFPRIPLYPDFARWAAWGEALLRLHLGYEQVDPWPLSRVDAPDPKRAAGTHPRPVLKSDPAAGLVRVDADTQLTGIPAHAWDYRLGNRSAIDWVLDQHKEKTPRDPVIRARFDTYRFHDHKEPMIDLLARVVRVSVETAAITEAMRGAERAVEEA